MEERQEIRQGADTYQRATFYELLVPAAISTALCTVVVWIALVYFGADLYGLAFFLWVPIVLGFVAALILDWRVPRAFADCAWSGLLALGVASSTLLIIGFEGLICILMALPVSAPSMIFGVWVAWIFSGWRWRKRHQKGLMACSLVLIPFFLIAETRLEKQPEVRTLQTSMVIDATPEEIWPHMSTLTVSPPTAGLLRAGVAHPVQVITPEPYLGGARICRLSTGDMNERITAWEPGRLLAFKVLNTPPTMRELNPFSTPSPAHLEGWYECLEGEFRLRPLPGGGVELTGSSTYQHRFGPRAYWSLWTDHIVRQVHLMVMRDVKLKAER